MIGIDITTYVAILHNAAIEEHKKKKWFEIRDKWILLGAISTLKALYTELVMKGMKIDGSDVDRLVEGTEDASLN